MRIRPSPCAEPAITPAPREAKVADMQTAHFAVIVSHF